MKNLGKLLAECDARGIRLFLSGSDELTIDAPRQALTPDLLGQLKAHKADLLIALRGSAIAENPDRFQPNRDRPASGNEPICRCGSATWRDVSIHGGQSIRRDCARCGKFLSFPQWYGVGKIPN